MPVPLNESGLPLDPATLQAIQQQNLVQQVNAQGGGARERMNEMSVDLAASTLFPNAQMRQAQAAQTALQGAAVTQGDGESDLDFSIRQMRAQRDALSQVSPEAAAALNTKLLLAGNAKFEQDRLRAADQQQQATFDAGAGERAQEQATGGLSYLIKPDQSAPLGYRVVGSYDMTKQDESQKFLDDRKANPQAIPLSAAKAGALFQSSNTADMKIAGELAKAQMQRENGLLTPDAVPGTAVQSIFDKTWLSRLTPQGKSQIQTFYAQHGITPTDIAGAQMEYKAMSSAAGQVGRREGNIKILQNSLGQMGDQVNQSLQGLTRTDFTPLNTLIMMGKTQFSDPGEARYAAAVQTFVNEYARLIAGGTGTSTEGARKEAWATLNKAGGPAGIASAVQQMGQRETQIVMNAGDSALEYFARPDNYKALSKIQERAGMPPPFMSNADNAVANPQPAPSPTPAPPAATGLPAGWSVTVR